MSQCAEGLFSGPGNPLIVIDGIARDAMHQHSPDWGISEPRELQHYHMAIEGSKAAPAIAAGSPTFPVGDPVRRMKPCVICLVSSLLL